MGMMEPNDQSAIDRRLYLKQAGWTIHVHHGQTRLLCTVADDHGYYPRIAEGEIYLTRDSEVLCLNTAVKRGVITPDRPMLRPNRVPNQSEAYTLKPDSP